MVDFTKYPVRGIDVSKWQVATPDLTGKAFLVARASIGTTSDPLYGVHIANARAAGCLVGAYHFNWSSPNATPEEQARFFLAEAGTVDFLFLDVEGAMAFSSSESKRFIAEVHRLGKKCGLYMSASVFRDDGQDYDWIAKWSKVPPARPGWEFWQYGSDPDYAKTIDGNVFSGTLAELRRLSMLYQPAEEPVDTFNILEDILVTAALPAGTVLYRDTALTRPAVTLASPIDARYVGQHSVSPDVRSVAYEPESDAGTSSPVYFVPRSSIATFTRHVIYSQADMLAERARADAIKSKVAALAADVADD